MNKILKKIFFVILIFIAFTIVLNNKSLATGYKYENKELTYEYKTKKGKTKKVKYTYNSTGVTPGQNRPVFIMGGTASKIKEAKEYGGKYYVYEDEIEDLIEATIIYYQPDHTANDKNSSLDNILENVEKFLSSGVSNIDKAKLQQLSQILYSILLTIGIAASVIIGAMLGIKLMTSTPEGKAQVSKTLVPYIAGCVILFGSFVIWKTAVTIFFDIESSYSSSGNSNGASQKSEVIKGSSKKKVSKKGKYSIEERAEKRAKEREKKLAQKGESSGIDETINTSLPKKTQAFLMALKGYLKLIDTKWVYSNSPSLKGKKANCAVSVTWALRKVGVIGNGKSVCVDGANKIRNEEILKKKMKKIYVGGKTMSKLIKSNTIREGDIVFWSHTTHTNVYAGNAKWYDSGSSATKKVNRIKRYKYNGLDKPRKISYLNNGSQKIHALFRFE